MKSTRIKTAIMMTLLTVAAMMTVACEQGPDAVDAQEPTVSLTATDQSMMVGETTTIMAQTGNLLGREVDINWDTSLGEIEPSDDGRMARFTSDEPGTAVVQVEMSVNGQILRDRINITVDAVE